MNLGILDIEKVGQVDKTKIWEVSPCFKVVIQKKSRSSLKSLKSGEVKTRSESSRERNDLKQNLKIKKFRFLQELNSESPFHSTQRFNFTARSRISSAKLINPMITRSFLSSKLNFTKIKIKHDEKKALLRTRHGLTSKKMMVIGKTYLNKDY